MKTNIKAIILTITLCVVWSQALAQQSDYAVKTNFRTEYDRIKKSIDESRSTAELEAMVEKINSLESQYSAKSPFLDKALYPETFSGMLSDLRFHHALVHERIFLIQDQVGRISELETKMAELATSLETLNEERTRLFAELKSTKQSLASLQNVVKRLSNNLLAKDRLIFALIDSIFLPYSADATQLSEVQKTAISGKLEKTNVVEHIYDIASDNVRFLGMTQLGGKDYSSLFDHYYQFATRWMGLRDKISAIGLIGDGKSGKGTANAEEGIAATQVDSALLEWQAKLHTAVWSALANEFSSQGVEVIPFDNAQSFSESIREYVQAAKVTGEDTKTFVKDVWIDRVDKEWRDVLIKDSMLGRTEYASLDKLVGELEGDRFDWMIVLYAVLVLGVGLMGWRIAVSRKPKPEQAPLATKPQS
ncbi:MAG: hypothetical protein HY708_01330 [Ignavibacteriae bacterium]|nr:hypothetical protein [Ignavibacteriota bacterium]